MQLEQDGPHTLDNFACKEGIPPVLHSDNSKMKWWGTGWLKWLHNGLCQAKYTKPHHPQQNPAKMHAIQWLKENSCILCKCTGAPDYTWLHSCQYLANIHNITANETLDWHTPWENANLRCWTFPLTYNSPSGRKSTTSILQNLTPLPANSLHAGLVLCTNVGGHLTFWLITEDTKKEIEHSIVIPARYATNKTIHWDPALDCQPLDDEVHHSPNRQQLNAHIAKFQHHCQNCRFDPQGPSLVTSGWALWLEALNMQESEQDK